LVSILLIKVVFQFSLFSRVFPEKIKKSLDLIEMNALRTSFKEERRFNEVLMAKKIKAKGLREFTVGHALWHNHTEILQ